MLRHVNLTLVGWAMRKFKRFQGRKVGPPASLRSWFAPDLHCSNTGVSA